MKKTYQQLTEDDRDKIAVFLAGGFNYSDIAKMLGRNRSTIMREIQRNGAPERFAYTPHRAQSRAQERKKTANTHDRLRSPMLRQYVEDKLKEEWSPEQIAGRLRLDHPGQSISYEAIYQYIYAQKPQLRVYLVRHYRIRRKRRPKTTSTVNRIPNRVGLDQRPAEANERQEFGHWESDMAVSRQSKSALLVLLERVSRYTMLRKVKRNTAVLVSEAIIQRLQALPGHCRKTITYDNGKENTNHEFVNEQLETKSFFCAPYCAWQKGSVENTVGLVRRDLPKKTDFANVPDEVIAHIEYQINSRPRKCLGFRTPAEVATSIRVALPC